MSESKWTWTLLDRERYEIVGEIRAEKEKTGPCAGVAVALNEKKTRKICGVYSSRRTDEIRAEIDVLMSNAEWKKWEYYQGKLVDGNTNLRKSAISCMLHGFEPCTSLLLKDELCYFQLVE
jgi:hypothetical protein